MKELLLLVTTLALAAPALAERPYYVFGEPTMIVKYGVWPSSDAEDNAGKTNAITVEYETDNCKSYKFCYNPYFVHISNDAGKNSGFGFNAKYNLFKRPSDAFYVEAGPVVFEDLLNNNDSQHITSHIGTGVQAASVILSFDVYGIEDNIPSFMINVGGHF